MIVKSPRISVITSTLNDAQNLRITLENIASLNYPNLEYIVIDGGSNDGTLDLLNEYQQYIDHWVSESDHGIYDAWNKGINIATGNYLAFLGAGDTYLPNGLENLAVLANAHQDADFVFGRVMITYENREPRIIGKPWQWDLFRHYMCTTHVGAWHSKRLFDKYGVFDPSYRIAGDYELLLRPKESLVTAYSDSVIATMRAGGISQQSFKVLSEVRRAKHQHQTVNSITNFLDYTIASTKLFVRQQFLD